MGKPDPNSCPADFKRHVQEYSAFKKYDPCNHSLPPTIQNLKVLVLSQLHFKTENPNDFRDEIIAKPLVQQNEVYIKLIKFRVH